MSTHFETELQDLNELIRKMQDLGFEYVNPVTIYVDTKSSLTLWGVHTFYLFAKSIGNIAVFRVANLLFYTDFERISPITLNVRQRNGEHFYVEVNAVFEGGRFSYYFYVPY
jgi:hypothetical protein